MKRFTFDTETTGIEPGSRLVEIHSALLGDDGAVVDEFRALVHPGMPIPADAGAIHGITDAEVNGASTANEVLADWRAWLANTDAAIGIAHNAPYDVGVIGWELGRAGMEQPGVHIIDTCAMAKAIKATKKNSLDALVEHYGITRQGQAHRAASDSLACREYYLIALRLLGAVGAVPWAPEYHYPAVIPPRLAGLPDAIEKAQPFAFAYIDAKGNRTDRKIIPYGMAETDKGVSFHGLCLMRNERRTFLADRIDG